MVKTHLPYEHGRNVAVRLKKKKTYGKKTGKKYVS
jgi:hypothetical protein